MSATLDLDLDRFRLRRFIDRLRDIGELEEHDEPVALADLSAIIEATPKTVLFHQAGPERCQMVGNVMGSRARLAAAMGVPEAGMVAEVQRRYALAPDIIEVPGSVAPVQQVVLTGDQIDLMKLPFHLQHELDGGPYISSAIDWTVDPATGKRNVGCRRLMLRSRNTMRSNLSQPSDLQRLYRAAVARGEKLPVSFAIGNSPLDFLAAVLRNPGDEFALVSQMRGAALPMVRGVSHDLLAPADAEMVIEGYFDELGYRELEGPYGEFWGFYGPVHIDPVFHVTAITMRRDVLHHTLLHGGRKLAQMEMAPLAALHAEAAILRGLRGINIEPAAIHVVMHAGPRQHVRVALRNAAPGQARRVISALHAMPGGQHVTVLDDDVDVRDDQEVEWAMSTRFRADRDLVVQTGFVGYYADPTAEQGQIAKIGFDVTMRRGRASPIEDRRPNPPRVQRAQSHASVRAALADRPMYFAELMQALGSGDGRELVVQLDALREQGVLRRLENGEWALNDGEKS